VARMAELWTAEHGAKRRPQVVRRRSRQIRDV
jgi:hypothetical protein